MAFGYPDSHPGVWQDNAHKAKVLAEGHEPCERCEGTGNELYAMYRRCKDCGGSGQKEKKPHSEE